MNDKEHEEWLENRNARKAAAKNNQKTPPLPPKRPADSKKEAPDTDENGRAWWRGEV